MEKNFLKILMVTIITVVIFGFLGVHEVKAATTDLTNAFNSSCGVTGDKSLTPCAVQLFDFLIYSSTASILTGAGFVFDVMVSFALNSANLDSPSVRTAWGTLRDFANLLFILILIFISVTIILGVEQYGGKKLLINVIVIALTINFSLFISRVVIDTGNITAGVFYNAISVNDRGEGIKSISGGFLSFSNPTTLVGDQMFSQWLTKGAQNWGMIFLTLLVGTIINLIFSYYLFVGGFMFITRTAFLWVLMAVSPLAFIAYTIPGTKNYFGMWWKKLVDMSFCPAILLFLFWFSLSLLGQGTFSEINRLASNSADVFISTITLIILKVAISATLLAIALNTTKKFCGESIISRTGERLAKGAVGLGTAAAIGGAALAGRGTLGRFAASRATGAGREALQDRIAQGGIRGRLASLQLRGYEGVAGARFGGRQSYGEALGARTRSRTELATALGRVRTGETPEQARERVAEYARTLQRPTFGQPEGEARQILDTNTGQRRLENATEIARRLENSGQGRREVTDIATGAPRQETDTEFARRLSRPTILSRMGETLTVSRADREAGERLAKETELRGKLRGREDMRRQKEIEIREIRERLKGVPAGPAKDVILKEEKDKMKEIDDIKDEIEKIKTEAKNTSTT